MTQFKDKEGADNKGRINGSNIQVETGAATPLYESFNLAMLMQS